MSETSIVSAETLETPTVGESGFVPFLGADRKKYWVSVTVTHVMQQVSSIYALPCFFSPSLLSEPSLLHKCKFSDFRRERPTDGVPIIETEGAYAGMRADRMRYINDFQSLPVILRYVEPFRERFQELCREFVDGPPPPAPAEEVEEQELPLRQEVLAQFNPMHLPLDEDLNTPLQSGEAVYVWVRAVGWCHATCDGEYVAGDPTAYQCTTPLMDKPFFARRSNIRRDPPSNTPLINTRSQLRAIIALEKGAFIDFPEPTRILAERSLILEALGSKSSGSNEVAAQ